MAQMPIANEASNKLSARESMQLYDHGDALQSLSSRSALDSCLDDLRAWLGLREIVVAACNVDELPEATVIGSGHDAGWFTLYLRERFVLVDPIVRGILGGKRFLNRAEEIASNNAVPRHNPRKRALERFLEAAHDYGRFREGFATGVVFNGRLVLCSTITEPGRSSRNAAVALHALRPLLLGAVMRVQLPAPVHDGLSAREQTLLESLACGYTDTQIADSLSISTSTVRFHIGNVFEKLGARNRCHAVAIGFQTGLL